MDFALGIYLFEALCQNTQVAYLTATVEFVLGAPTLLGTVQNDRFQLR